MVRSFEEEVLEDFFQLSIATAWGKATRGDEAGAHIGFFFAKFNFCRDLGIFFLQFSVSNKKNNKYLHFTL